MFRYIIASMLLVLSGCASFGAPELDTNEKKLVAAEITFQEMVETAIRIQPRLTDSAREDVFSLLNDTHTALVAARVAFDADNVLDFTNQISVVRSTIDVLRPILEAMEEEAHNGYSIQFTRIA